MAALTYTVRWRIHKGMWTTVRDIDNKSAALYKYIKVIMNGALEARIEQSEGGLYAEHKRRED